jgi:hypothetical protein
MNTLDLSGSIPFYDGIPVYPIFGATVPVGRMGTHTAADIVSGSTLVSQTADGVDLNTLFEELTELLSIWNKERSGIADLLSFKVDIPGEAVPQSISIGSFEEATEFGIPVAQGPPGEALLLGYDRLDYDKRSSFTWKFLRDSTAAQVSTVINAIVHADNRLTTGRVLRRVMNPAVTRNEFGWKCYGLWAGDMAPPPYLGTEFPDTTTMYWASGASAIDSADIEDAVKAVRSHGFGLGGSTGQMLILANPAESELIQAFRAGEPSRSAGPNARYSFIPSVKAPPYLTTETLVGQPVSNDFHGIEVLGSYGVSFLIESPFVPAGYVIVAASGGVNSPSNVVGFRQHPDPNQQGLRVIPGLGPYPIVDAFHARTFGVGTRLRGAAAVIQVTTGSTYTPPSPDKIPV